MSAMGRKAVVAGLVVTFLVAVVFGQRIFGRASGVVVMLAAFVAGFAWLWLLVAPWAVVRHRPRR